MAERAPFAEVSLEGDIVVSRSAPRLTMSGVAVTIPPTAFVQAVGVAEARLADLVVDGVGKARRVADLFCGLGPFSFTLARRAKVLAIDSESTAVTALAAATRHATGLKPIETRTRDLFREPLARKELEGIDAVVLDPPRAGAQAQAEMLARSGVPTVVMVSCNPATMARDCRILVDAGFDLGAVTPVDQFLYAPHVEAVAVLTR
jgi:23S rRNA (uracil1939-C5)-methyltransferase